MATRQCDSRQPIQVALTMRDEVSTQGERQLLRLVRPKRRNPGHRVRETPVACAATSQTNDGYVPAIDGLLPGGRDGSASRRSEDSAEMRPKNIQTPRLPNHYFFSPPFFDFAGAVLA